MRDMIPLVFDRSEIAGSLISPLLAIAAGLLVVTAILRAIRLMLKEAQSLKRSEAYHSLVGGLYYLFDWPTFSLLQPRRKSRAKPAEALIFLAGALLGILVYAVVAVALVYLGKGLLRPLGESALGIIYLVAAIAFARASMIAAVKRWYGIL